MRPRRLPALFNVHSCLIKVALQGKPTRAQLPNSPHALYSKLWPKAREAAATVLHTCLAKRQAAGNMHLPFDVDGFRGQMLVGVYRREGKHPPKDGGGRRTRAGHRRFAAPFTRPGSLPKRRGGRDEARRTRRALPERGGSGGTAGSNG